jgi:glycosyltransferase involved in cell wall biosynthesis
VTLGVFWGSLLAVVGTYLAFPLLALVRSAVRPQEHRESPDQPSLTVVIAAHDEAAGIAAKLDSVLAAGYDPLRLDVVVAADGCLDDTERVVAGYAGRGVRLLALPRVGKAAALNAAVATSRADVLVFTDANGLLAPGALAALVRPFADPGVGGVAGDQRYAADAPGDGIATGERSYWSFDRLVKRAESRAGNVISATGALYAVRRSLFQPVAEGVTDDFYVSTAVIVAGSRLVFARDAVVHEPVAPSGNAEYARKVRILTRGLQGVLLRRELLDPRRHGFYSVQLLAHKVLRRLMVFPLAALLASSVAARHRGPWFRLLALGQATFYAAGAAGLGLGRSGRGCPRALAVPAYFCLVNVAALRAVLNVARGRRIDRWEPARTAQPEGRG